MCVRTDDLVLMSRSVCRCGRVVARRRLQVRLQGGGSAGHVSIGVRAWSRGSQRGQRRASARKARVVGWGRPAGGVGVVGVSSTFGVWWRGWSLAGWFAFADRAWLGDG